MAEISDLKNKISEKLEEGTFSGEDLEDYFQVFCEIGRNCDDFQEEIEVGIEPSCLISMNQEFIGFQQRMV